MTRFGAAVRAHLGLADMTPGAGRGLLYILVLVFLVVGGAYYQSARSVNDLRMSVLAQCKFNADLAGAPIAVNPATHHASLLGVSIVVDARQAWRGLGCAGTLPPPTPSLIRWAHFFKLPAN